MDPKEALRILDALNQQENRNSGNRLSRFSARELEGRTGEGRRNSVTNARTLLGGWTGGFV